MTKESLIQPYGIAADNNFYMTNHQDLIFVPEVELRIINGWPKKIR